MGCTEEDNFSLKTGLFDVPHVVAYRADQRLSKSRVALALHLGCDGIQVGFLCLADIWKA